VTLCPAVTDELLLGAVNVDFSIAEFEVIRISNPVSVFLSTSIDILFLLSTKVSPTVHASFSSRVVPSLPATTLRSIPP
jgi:hypothetical protein